MSAHQLGRSVGRSEHCEMPRCPSASVHGAIVGTCTLDGALVLVCVIGTRPAMSLFIEQLSCHDSVLGNCGA